ncbi:MAG: PHP domain-containing protein [Candidatus Hydrogenedentota bacterium]|nr:MAG: PHP domain-containing protein [Candidatus Hydrogenedentota bacterium]
MHEIVPTMSENLLKVDLHTHSADDPEEPIRHTSCELIDKAYYLGFDAISITNHDAISFSRYLQDYARERGIVLIPGVELNIQRKHVLVVNAHEGILRARTFDDLKRLRTPSNMVVAPHPYFPDLASLLWWVEKKIDVFDAIEFSWFYHSLINFNRFAMRTAMRNGLPLLCTSDCHHLENFGSAYSLVDAEKDAEAITEAVKAGRVQIAANPLKLLDFGKHGLEHVVDSALGALRSLLFGENQ